MSEIQNNILTKVSHLSAFRKIRCFGLGRFPVWNTDVRWTNKSISFLMKLFWCGSDNNCICWDSRILHVLFSDGFFHEKTNQLSFLYSESRLLCEGEGWCQLILKSSRLFLIKWWSQQQRWRWHEPHKVGLILFFYYYYYFLPFYYSLLNIWKKLAYVNTTSPLKLLSVIYASCN